jgi:predicted metalloendopeptidase
MRPERRRDFSKTDDHAPADARVIGSLANFKEFSKAFSCPENSIMNPAIKCNLIENFDENIAF